MLAIIVAKEANEVPRLTHCIIFDALRSGLVGTISSQPGSISPFLANEPVAF
jgi:hypothetical protein